MIGKVSDKGSDLWIVTQLLLRAGSRPETAEYEARGLLEDAREQAEIRLAAWRQRAKR